MQEDLRLNLLNQWLVTVIDPTSFIVEPASSDASFRRYFRVSQNDKTWIVMDAPPNKEDIKPFISIAQHLFQHGVNVPEIDAINYELGFILLSDFGSVAYLDELNDESSNMLYQSAIDSLLTIQQCPVNDNYSIPSYDQHLLQRELQLFPEWFLEKHLGLTPPNFLQETFEILINNALEQPQVFVHRDYHSRNLMHTQTNSPGIIDFQDAVIGPVSYDLVSLLRDCYISWPQEKLEQWIKYYLVEAKKYNLLSNVSTEQFIRWFDLMGLQRHIKVLGIFCRLNYRDNKSNYINDLPLTLSYVQQIASKYPEFDELSAYLKQIQLKATI